MKQQNALPRTPDFHPDDRATNGTPFDRCRRCESTELEWTGHASFGLTPVSFLTAKGRNVQRCLDCGLVWRYLRSGRRITPKLYRVWRPFKAHL